MGEAGAPAGPGLLPPPPAGPDQLPGPSLHPTGDPFKAEGGASEEKEEEGNLEGSSVSRVVTRKLPWWWRGGSLFSVDKKGDRGTEC